MKHSECRDKFYDAVRSLIFGSGAIRERVMNAYIIFKTVSVADIDDDLSENLVFIYRSLGNNLAGEYTVSTPEIELVKNTLQNMSEAEVVEIAEKIYNLNNCISGRLIGRKKIKDLSIKDLMPVKRAQI